MADHQRVHPAQDVEAPPTPEVPLMPRGAPPSDKGDAPAAAPAATGATRQPYYPPFPRTLPAGHSKPPKRRRSCLCKCLCWTVLLLVLLTVLVAATGGILYLVFRPKLPKYSVDSLQISRFEIGSSDSLAATFEVNITARNPNERIGIYYEGGSRIAVWYAAKELCVGALPKFYQGHENTTVLAVPLSGRTDNATALVGSLQAQLDQAGFIPLTLRVRQPVRVKLGKLKLFKVKFLVRCRLNADSSLAANNNIRIRNSSCKFRLRL